MLRKMALDFSSICRLCLAPKESFRQLFGEDENLPARIMTVVPVIKINAGDSLPAQICHQCAQQVIISYNFKLQCESSDMALHRYLRNLHSQNDALQAVEKKEYSPAPSESGDDCHDNFFEVKVEVKFGESNFDGETGTSENSGKDVSEKKQGSSWCGQENGVKEKKWAARKSKTTSVNETASKGRGPRKKKLAAVKLESVKKEEAEPLPPADNSLSLDDDDGLEVIPIIKEKERFVCNECGNVFAQKSGLIKHLRTHTGEKPFCCAMCGKTFRQSGNLTLHIRTHTGEKPFACTVCGEAFGQSSTLTRHMRTHTGEKPFCCQVCGKSFGLRNTLTLHERSHMDDKPYRCSVCGKRFLRSSNLNEHMRTHTGEKPFVCSECGKSFIRRCDHKIHMRMHSGDKQFSCTECGKSFLRSTELKIHTRLHTGEKPYSCQDCGKRFIRSNQLKRHRKTHMMVPVIKPYRPTDSQPNHHSLFML